MQKVIAMYVALIGERQLVVHAFASSITSDRCTFTLTRELQRSVHAGSGKCVFEIISPGFKFVLVLHNAHSGC
jgi:hypothetical protein